MNRCFLFGRFIFDNTSSKREFSIFFMFYMYQVKCVDVRVSCVRVSDVFVAFSE